jgi:cysteine dioxygenase
LEHIKTIQELVRELLREPLPKHYGRILSRYKASSEDLAPYFRWRPRHYTRTCIHRNEGFELLLICYEPLQYTSIHDYDSGMAWVLPVMGEVIEERFIEVPGEGLRRLDAIHRKPGIMTRIIDDPSIRRFSNPGPGRAATLNLYARPMSRWRIYDELTGNARWTPPGPPR